MTQELTDYEIQKAKHKRLLVRNEMKTTGKYQIPIIAKQKIDFDEISLLSYVNTKKDDKENSYKTVHFFTHDWHFDKVYDNAYEEVEKLKQYYALLSPDFSMFVDMPIALQLYSVFKNRWCGAYWQSLGLKVIPTVSWGDERSFDFCFEGVEKVQRLPSVLTIGRTTSNLLCSDITRCSKLYNLPQYYVTMNRSRL